MSGDNHDNDDKEQLVSLLDRKVFDPVLKANPDDYSSQSDKDKLADLQQSTRSEKERYHDEYKTAKEVHDRYHDDLSSDPGKKFQRESNRLNLPSLPDVEHEFDQLSHRLGVG